MRTCDAGFLFGGAGELALAREGPFLSFGNREREKVVEVEVEKQ